MSVSPHEKGKYLEREIEAHILGIIEALTGMFGERVGALVKFEVQPRIELADGRTVIPDFAISYALFHGYTRFLVECQDRKRSEPQIAQKIRYVKTLSQETSFVFVYRDSIPATTESALHAAGVMTKNLEEFKTMVDQNVFEHLSVMLHREREQGIEFEPHFGDMRFN